MLELSKKSHKQRTKIRRLLSWGLVLCLSLSGAVFTSAVSAQNVEPPEPIIDWQKRQAADERLTVFGDDLLGDSIDPHIGSIVFEHTDVSLPGNSNLEVAVRRRLTQGYKYDEGVNVEFGDWELLVPQISAVATAEKPWMGQRCNDDWQVNFPSIQVGGNAGSGASNMSRADYSNGVNMSIPGQGSQQVLKVSASILHSGRANTVNDWYFTCTTASDGKEGFVGHAPNGDIYQFKQAIMRPYKELGYANKSVKTARVKIILAATEVKDVNGNWVRYSYDNSSRLTEIEANDGRVITLGYNGNLISTVTANGRSWCERRCNIRPL
ncbi:MAG: RHS repeat protein [Robiginitomaculum sp.]|nr:RHS repeat protein [Robiginitomaculum sp.]